MSAADSVDRETLRGDGKRMETEVPKPVALLVVPSRASRAARLSGDLTWNWRRNRRDEVHTDALPLPELPRVLPPPLKDCVRTPFSL